MKVSEILKKIGFLSGTQIRIEFKENKQDESGEIECITEYTSEETADRIIERAAEYTLSEIDFINNAAFITGIRIVKRTPKPKKETPGQQDKLPEEVKKDVAYKMARLNRAITDWIDALAAAIDQKGSRNAAEKQRGILQNIRAAIRRIVARLFRKDADANA